MYRQLFFLVAILFIVSPAGADTLWDKAVLHCSNPRPLPQELVLEEKFLNKDGKIAHISVINAKLFRNNNDQIIFIADTGTANGASLPTDELQKMTEVLAEKDLQTTLFTSNPQSKVVWREEQDQKVIGTHACRRFTFTSEMSEHRAEGGAWLAIDSGLPLQVEWRFLDVPFQDDDSTINGYHQTDDYVITDGGECALVRSEAVIALKYSLFFIPYEGELQRRTTFSKHSRRQDLPHTALADK